MKVIDLLNKIANGEEAPKMIKIHNEIYKKDDYNNKYYANINNYISELLSTYKITESFLNDEIEIIEEPKNIEKLNIELNMFDNNDNKVNCYRATNLECDIAYKINEIIDYINSKEDK